MSRVRRGSKARQRRNKILKAAKGFHFDRKSKYRHARPTVERALHYAWEGRRLFKRDMRKLWIVRINAAAKAVGSSYSRLINQLKNNDVRLNRKMLSEIAARDFDAFKSLTEALK